VNASRSLLAGKSLGGPASARLSIDGRQFISFFGSGYLALSGVPEIRDAVLRTLQAGAPFAQHVPGALGGIDPPFDAVERAAAAACGSEASVYFASGYFIGVVALASLEEPPDLLFLDESAHYSLRDAATLYGRTIVTFPHRDAQGLRDLLRTKVRPNQRPVILTDGVFPTTGSVAPLADYAREIAQYGGRLLVDEAHAFGVVGENGRGAAELCGVEEITAMGATLSKAYCAQGAFVACSAETAARLRRVPSIIGASAGSPLSAAAAAASLEYVAKHPSLRTHLSAMTRYLRAKLQSIGVSVIDSPAPIVSFTCGDREEMTALQRRLFEKGIYIHHSTYIGSGPNGMIRCAVFRDHTHADIDEFISALR
jgi:7-keto-8-aminopelargonate synthetase-like enzyme